MMGKTTGKIGLQPIEIVEKFLVPRVGGKRVHGERHWDVNKPSRCLLECSITI